MEGGFSRGGGDFCNGDWDFCRSGGGDFWRGGGGGGVGFLSVGVGRNGEGSEYHGSIVETCRSRALCHML